MQKRSFGRESQSFFVPQTEVLACLWVQGSIAMGEVKEKELFVNPYVIQMDKFAGSLKHLSETFLGLEKGRRTLTGEEIA